MIAPDASHINLRDIDLDHLEDVEDNREAVYFRVRLTENPSDAWVQEFDQAYLKTPYLLKPPVTVVEDALEVVYLPRYVEELPGFFRFLALVARRANEETQRSHDLQTTAEQNRQRVAFREALARIELPAPGQAGS